MRATLVCISKFHLFALARELLRRDMLTKIFSGYPSWKLQDEDIPRDRFETYPWLQTPFMALSRWELLKNAWFRNEFTWHAHQTLDHYVAKRIPQCDILLALSGSGLHCGREAQRRGFRYICDRGSSHIRYQDTILREEYARWGESFHGIDQRVIEKEESEYETADVVTIPSSFAYRSFVEMGVPESKLHKIPYGVDLRRFEKVADPNPKTFDVLFVGQVGFRKGVPYLIEAFRKMKHPKKRLTFVGSIQSEMSRFLKKYSLPEQVFFTGPLPQAELKYLMSRSHVMVIGSIEEGLALVQAQAMACGCPVIGTLHSGAEDLLTNNKEGFIVPIRDAQAISEKLQFLADAPEQQAIMGHAAIERIRILNGWAEYGEQMSNLMKQLVKS